MKPSIRARLYHLVNAPGSSSKVSKIYNYVMIAAIIISLIPLCFKQYHSLFFFTDLSCTVLFVADYALRWTTSDYLLNKGKKSFILYPFTPMAVIDLLTILPFFLPLNQGFKTLRLLRMVRALRAIRFIRESRSFKVIENVLMREKALLLSVGAIALGYILLCALVIFNVEPDTFASFFDAVYWACVSLTTVGYGDIYPTSIIGRVVTMVSSLVGVALIALPAGIITGGYIEEMRKAVTKEE